MDIKELEIKPLEIIKVLMGIVNPNLLYIIEKLYGKIVFDMISNLESNLIGKTVKVKEVGKIISKSYINDYNEYFIVNSYQNTYYITYWIFDENGEEAIIKAIKKDGIELNIKGKDIVVWKIHR